MKYQHKSSINSLTEIAHRQIADTAKVMFWEQHKDGVYFVSQATVGANYGKTGNPRTRTVENGHFSPGAMMDIPGQMKNSRLHPGEIVPSGEVN